MRREGYELAVSRPQVVQKEVDGKTLEPYEQLTVDLDESYRGAAMEMLGTRGGELKDMFAGWDAAGFRLDYVIPARGLIGLRTDFLTATSGTGFAFTTPSLTTRRSPQPTSPSVVMAC